MIRVIARVFTKAKTQRITIMSDIEKSDIALDKNEIAKCMRD